MWLARTRDYILLILRCARSLYIFGDSHFHTMMTPTWKTDVSSKKMKNHNNPPRYLTIAWQDRQKLQGSLKGGHYALAAHAVSAFQKLYEMRIAWRASLRNRVRWPSWRSMYGLHRSMDTTQQIHLGMNSCHREEHCFVGSIAMTNCFLNYIKV